MATVLGAVLVLAGLGITGFVAPGFLLSDEGDTFVGGSTMTTAASAEVEFIESGPAVPAVAMTVMQGFLDAVNTGQAAAAKAALCENEFVNAADVDELIGYDPDLAVDPTMDWAVTTVDKSVQSVQLTLTGTANGQELTGDTYNLMVTNWNGPWCVWDFRVVVT